MYFIIGGDGKQYGPISNEELRKWVNEGRLNAGSRVKGEHDADFRPLSQFAEFTDLFVPRTPLQVGASSQADAESDAAQRIKIPAIALIVVSSIGVLYYIFSAILTLVGGAQPMQNTAGMPPEWQHFMERMQQNQHGPMAFIISLAFVAMNAFVLFGSIKMLKLQSYGLAVAASVIAMLPCGMGCCCVFSIPIGIWALVVLNKPEVKSQFS